jgi:hypothetical protein
MTVRDPEAPDVPPACCVAAAAGRTGLVTVSPFAPICTVEEPFEVVTPPGVIVVEEAPVALVPEVWGGAPAGAAGFGAAVSPALFEEIVLFVPRFAIFGCRPSVLVVQETLLPFPIVVREATTPASMTL